MKKEFVSCNLCGSEKYAVLFTDELGDNLPKVDYKFSLDTMKTYQIVKCDSCNLIYTNPMPRLNEAYRDSIEDKTYVASKKERVRRFEKCIQDILKFKQGGDLLDIGCSIGIFLDVASEYFNAEGIELSAWARSEAIKRHKVYDKPLSELNLKKKYDIITLFGVIEHFENPTKELTSIYNALKPGGFFVLWTGDADAWLSRLLGKKWWWFQGMHTFYFSRKTCAALLKKCGFKVVKTKNLTVFFQLFSLGIALQRYKIGRILKPFFNIPFLKNLQVPLTLSGEMLVFAIKR